MLSPQVVDELKRIVGSKHVLTDPEELFLFRYDASLERGRPDVVVLPGSTEEVAGVVRLAYERGIPVTPRGAGTNLSGGSVPTQGGIVLVVNRLNRVLEIDVANRFALVEAGVFNLTLQKALAPYGYHYAPDPASQKVSTLGGNVGENSGGPHCFKYGVTLNHVLGLELVLPYGRISWFGGKAPESPGYDLVSLVVGSEGTLGIVTKALVRIMLKPEGVRTFLVLFDSLREAGQAVSATIAAGIVPSTLEMMDALVIQAVEKATRAGLPQDATALLIIEVDGLNDDLDEQIAKIKAICQQNGACGMQAARDEAERDQLWASRRGAFGALGQLMPNYLVLDGTVPRTQLPEALERVADVGRRYGLPVGNVFHAGDGNLHPLILFDPREPDIVQKVRSAGTEILKICTQLGGTITGEHGIGTEKIAAMSFIFEPADLQAMVAVKRAFDPPGLMNPGKILPPDIADTRNNQLRMPNKTIKSLQRALPMVKWLNQPEELSHYVVSERTPKLLALPRTAEQVAGVLNAVDQLSGKLIVWDGTIPRDTDNPSYRQAIVLDLKGMNRVLEYDKDNLTITVQAGCSLSALQDYLRPSRQWFPLEAPDPRNATVGEMLAQNVSGPRRLKFGTAHDMVLGMEVALVSGQVIHSGGRTVKNVAGYNLHGLFIGSRNTLGVMTAATLRTSLLPAEEKTVLVYFKMPEEAFAFVQELCASCLFPSAIEVMDPLLQLEGLRTKSELMLAAVLLEGSKPIVQRQLRDILGIAERSGAKEHNVIQGNRHVRLWATLRMNGWQRAGKDAVHLRIGLPPAQLPEAWDLLAGEGGFRQARAGTGLLFVSIPDAVPRRLEHYLEEITRRGGHSVIEQAPLSLREALSAWQSIGEAEHVLKALREKFDPHGILSAIASS